VTGYSYCVGHFRGATASRKRSPAFLEIGVLSPTYLKLFIVVAAFCWTNKAAAQAACAPYDAVVKQLATNHQEQAVALGLMPNGALIQVFTAQHGETWTIVRVRPDGAMPTCVMAAGTDWATSSPSRNPESPL
jgi:hypothetical protein